jgi:hypothetical protein
VVTRLQQALDASGQQADLPGYARRVLFPVFKGRSRTRPIDHPAYRDLAFVERAGKQIKHPAPPDVDQEVRVFLRRADWDQRTDELERLLVKNPHWSEQPFLELLPAGPRAWWQFWGGKEVPPAQLAVALRFLKERPTPTVKARAADLRKHADPAVAAAAEAIR